MTTDDVALACPNKQLLANLGKSQDFVNFPGAGSHAIIAVRVEVRSIRDIRQIDAERDLAIFDGAGRAGCECFLETLVVSRNLSPRPLTNCNDSAKKAMLTSCVALGDPEEDAEYCGHAYTFTYKDHPVHVFEFNIRSKGKRFYLIETRWLTLAEWLEAEGHKEQSPAPYNSATSTPEPEDVEDVPPAIPEPVPRRTRTLADVQAENERLKLEIATLENEELKAELAARKRQRKTRVTPVASTSRVTLDWSKAAWCWSVLVAWASWQWLVVPGWARYGLIHFEIHLYSPPPAWRFQQMQPL
jgi:hypothetical protein